MRSVGVRAEMRRRPLYAVIKTERLQERAGRIELVVPVDPSA